MFKFYEVGGCVRDEILGLKSKDIDYVAVAGEDLLRDVTSPQTLFGILEEYLKLENFEIFLVTADCFTIRAKFPADHRYQGIADFVMARKETGYIPFTRTPVVVPGTLYDDLERRDFTLNALAKDEDGNFIQNTDGSYEIVKGSRLKEELAEINIAAGVEWWYNDVFAVRSGVFIENKNKGNRQFLNFGASLKYNMFAFDFSYLASISGRQSPLANTLRFTIRLYLGQGGGTSTAGV